MRNADGTAASCSTLLVAFFLLQFDFCSKTPCVAKAQPHYHNLLAGVLSDIGL